MKSIIEENEHLLIMDLWDAEYMISPVNGSKMPVRTLNLDEMRRIRETGARTVVNFVMWADLEKKEGHIEWDSIDKIIERNRKTNFKSLLMVYDLAAEYFPPEYYVQLKDGTIFNDHAKSGWSMLSPWNKQAQTVSNEFITKVMSRYAASDVEFACSFGKEGESLLPPTSECWYDPAAVESRNRTSSRTIRGWLTESLTEYFLNTQNLFSVNWVMLHRAFDWTAGNYINHFYPKLKKPINGIQWTFWPHPSLQSIIQTDIYMHSINTFVGAEWCEGIKHYGNQVPNSILQGLIVGPIHPYSGHKDLEPWMVENMSNYLKMFKDG